MSYTTKQLKDAIRNGQYAWPGGYPLFFITNDGESLSFEAVKENYRIVLESTKYHRNDGWEIVGCEVNWENADLYCAHTSERIESAYAEDEAA